MLESRIKYCFLAICFFCLATNAYSKDLNSIDKDNHKIFLFGEDHSVKEKYDEIKAITFQEIEKIASGEKISFFMELPTSLNYVFYKIENEQDSSVFYEWFNHLYQAKDETTSLFWIDYRDFLIELMQFAKGKGIELKLRGVDREKEFRRTAFILSNFQNKVGATIDSLLNLSYIQNDSATKNVLIKYVNQLSEVTKDESEVKVLNILKKSLNIDCTVCLERDSFMYKMFTHYYDSSHYLTFGSFGLIHIVNQHNFSKLSDFFKLKHKVDTIGFQSLYSLLKKDFKGQIYRVGLIALNFELKLSNFTKPKDYAIISQEEKKYIEGLLKDTAVVRLHTNQHKNLQNLSSQVDYIVVYYKSNFR